MKMFNLYDDQKTPVVIVNRDINGTYTIKGMSGTQLQHVYRKGREFSELCEFKDIFNLRSEEELGQVTLDELLGGNK